MNRPLGSMGGQQNSGMSLQEQQTIKMMQGAMESCVAKTAMSGVAGKKGGSACSRISTDMCLLGFGMGAAFGLFMSSFEYAGPTMNEEMVKQTTKQQIKHAFKDMGTRSLSMAKNFGMVGMIYSGSECCIESVSLQESRAIIVMVLLMLQSIQYRAKNDLTNSVAAGAFTGGLLAAKAGPQAMALGAGGFALFSLAIDWYMRRD